MKRAMSFIIPFFLMAFGCEHDNVSNTIQGRWKIAAISGTIAGSQDIRDFDHLKLNDHDSYQVFFNNDVIQEGSYEIIKNNAGKEGEYDYFLMLKESHNSNPNANFYPNYPFKISIDGKNSLTLSQHGITDGFVYHFVRD
jgi:hypothetical protein